jgi:imidazolonepropionase-like amidohydrolase
MKPSAALTVFVALSACLRPAVSPPADLVITHVAVVDVDAGRVLPDRTLLISGNRIVLVDSSRARVPTVRSIDGKNAYVIPGLWDMHVHAVRAGRARWMFPLFIVNGVLEIRDTGSPLDSLLRYRRAVANGEVLGPRVFGSGPLLDGPRGQWPDFTIPIATAEQGRRAVDSLADAGVDFIKVYDQLSRDAFFAIARRARERRVPVAGHVPESVSALEASDSGMRSVEHLTVGPACLPRLAQIVEQSRRSVVPGLSPDSIHAVRRATGLRIDSSYDANTCRDVGARLARNGTWLVPTLSRERAWSRAFLASKDAGADTNLRYAPRYARTNWNTWRDSIVANRPVADEIAEVSRYQLLLRIARALRSNGVGILAGTDTDLRDAYLFGVPGFTLHAELETLVRDLEMTPAEALRSATLDPARFLGMTDSLGTVAPGKIADLVLLDANPLTDIRNTRRVRAVVRAGRLLDRAALDALLAKDEAAAR